jgi:hypothetical protein
VSTSDSIRELAGQGVAVADIARKLGIRYQHAYKVCRDAGIIRPKAGGGSPAPVPQRIKPPLSVETLRHGGFETIGRWLHEEERLVCPKGLPASGGVYAFSIGATVVYVGLASRSLVQRLYYYGRPGPSQRTNIRVNALIREASARGEDVDVHFACPPSFAWNGFTVSGAEGLEAGLIQNFMLPWNMRGTAG